MEVASKKSPADNIRATSALFNNSANMAASTSGAPGHTHNSDPSNDDNMFYGRTTRLMWKAQTEQAAASHQSPKWNEPDTDYTPPIKKPKKEKHREESATSTSSASSHPGKEKKKKLSSTSKTPKQPKVPNRFSSETSTSHRSLIPSSSTTHAVPSVPPISLPKATAPPPPPPPPAPALAPTPTAVPPLKTATPTPQATPIKVKIEEQIEAEVVHGGQLDAKTMNALHTIREAATKSAQAAAIQDAINSVLSQPPEAATAQTSTPVMHPVAYNAQQNLLAPVAVYPQPAPIAPPPPPPPVANVMPPCPEIVAAEQRHTFMIPPTDPFYDMIVSYYFAMKTFCNQSKIADREFVGRLRQDIEMEEARKNDLQESIQSTNIQIDELLAAGVYTLKSRLDELGMPSVTDVTELLAGSKQIVTQHKGLTNNVAQMENSVAIEEQKLRLIGGPDALRYFDEAINHSSVDILKLSELVVSTRPPNFVAQILPEDAPIVDSKVSPSSRRPRQPKPRQTTTGGSKRGSSAGRKIDGPTEDVELEIRQFVQHALKVDNAVKEKERKERLHRPGRPIVPNPVRPSPHSK